MDGINYIVFGVALIICKIIDAIAKHLRISKLEKLDNSKIESIGKCEGKAKSNITMLNIWRNKNDETLNAKTCFQLAEAYLLE
jgi:hypothetical protein